MPRQLCLQKQQFIIVFFKVTMTMPTICRVSMAQLIKNIMDNDWPQWKISIYHVARKVLDNDKRWSVARTEKVDAAVFLLKLKDQPHVKILQLLIKCRDAVIEAGHISKAPAILLGLYYSPKQQQQKKKSKKKKTSKKAEAKKAEKEKVYKLFIEKAMDIRNPYHQFPSCDVFQYLDEKHNIKYDNPHQKNSIINGLIKDKKLLKRTTHKGCNLEFVSIPISSSPSTISNSIDYNININNNNNNNNNNIDIDLSIDDSDDDENDEYDEYDEYEIDRDMSEYLLPPPAKRIKLENNNNNNNKQINCFVCTFLNDTYNEFCAMCRVPLPK